MLAHGSRGPRWLARNIEGWQQPLALVAVLAVGLTACGESAISEDEAAGEPLAHMLESAGDATDRVRELLEDSSTGGTVGLYLREVGGPVHAAYNESFVFEPASAIKSLVHFHAMRQVQDGAVIDGEVVTVDTLIPWMARDDKFDLQGDYIPGGSDCAASNTVPMATALLEPTLRWTMLNSDNATTQGLRDFFGDAAIDATRVSLDMSDSVLDHSIGCGGDAVDNPNGLTLVDAGNLYEAVATGYLDEEHRELAYSVMSNNLGALADIAEEEAVGLGLSDATLTEFNALRRSAAKGGSYGLTTGSYRSRAGWAEFAFKNAQCEIEPRSYVYGTFIHEANSAASSGEVAAISLELLREPIRAALESWAECPPQADLAIVDWDVSALDDAGILDFLLGEPFLFSTTKVLHNFGDTVYGLYDTPVDATVTVSVHVPAGVRGAIRDGNITVWGEGPTTISRNIPASGLEVGVDRVMDRVFGIDCLEPGLHAITFTSELWADDESIEDPDPSNNVVQIDRVVECIAPVQINIRPGNPQNGVVLNGNQTVPIAILTTEADEYGLLSAFDASAVDHTTVKFGTPGELNAGEGATASPNQDFIRDSFEMDDETKDGDLDMVLLFKTAGSGMDAQSTEGCLLGTYQGQDQGLYTFFGCDVVHLLGPGS